MNNIMSIKYYIAKILIKTKTSSKQIFIYVYANFALTKLFIHSFIQKKKNVANKDLHDN